jgi:hypothetical protein
MSALEQLKTQRSALNDWKDYMMSSALLTAFLYVPLAIIMPFVLWINPLLEPYLGDAGGWLESGAHPLGTTLAVLTIILMVGSVLVVPIWIVPSIFEAWWKRYEQRTRRLLHTTTLPALVASRDGYISVSQATGDRPLLRLTFSREPRNLQERFEFAADYWRALFVVAEGKYDRLPNAVRMSNALRKLDGCTMWYANGCIAIFVLSITLPLWFITLPLYLFSIGISSQQQAVQAALLDYLIYELERSK